MVGTQLTVLKILRVQVSKPYPGRLAVGIFEFIRCNHWEHFYLNGARRFGNGVKLSFPGLKTEQIGETPCCRGSQECLSN